jgi:hypothetical protein
MLLVLLFRSTPALAAKPCKTDEQCQEFGPESSCQMIDASSGDGTCSNRYISGCLHTTDPAKFEKRICNSNDAADSPHCIQPTFFNYTEIRIHHGDWESSIFYSWILQIVLGEILRVPITIGVDGAEKNSFYSIVSNTLEYPPYTYAFDAIETANKLVDCRVDSISNDTDSSKYSSKHCVHVLPEIWNGAVQQTTLAVRQEHVDPVEGNGQVGKASWYIPVHTAKTFPDFASCHGLSTRNRTQIAAVFKRPTSWSDYCAQESPTNCAVPDLVAQRAPESDSEASSYFQEGLFTGYFRATPENDCELYSTTCTGHIVAPPCSWSSFMDSQLYWNSVPLSSSGPELPNGSYTYAQMIQVWKAANATRSHVATWWWSPERKLWLYRCYLVDLCCCIDVLY